MKKYQLTKAQALKLITPVVDGEASETEREAFMEFIAENEEVHKKYKAMEKLKSLISSRCSRVKAPRSLQNRVQAFLNEVDDQKSSSNQEPIYDIPCNGPGSHEVVDPHTVDSSTFSSRSWLFSSAASMPSKH